MRPFVLPIALVFAIAAIAVVPSVRPAPGAANAATAVNPARTNATRALTSTQFVPNVGQWHDQVRYAALGNTPAWLHDDGFTVRLERQSSGSTGNAAADRAQREVAGCVLRTRFVDALRPEFVAAEPLATQRHFLRGRDASGWHTDVPGFDRVTMRGVQPGIDVVFRPLPGGQRGPFAYDLQLAPNAELSRFVARCEGADDLAIDVDGRLHVRAGQGDEAWELVQDAPIAWQCTPSGRRPLDVRFRRIDATSYGFVAVGLDPQFEAVVDPGVVWGTYLGGGLSDSVNALRWREGVGVWVAGWAASTDFPTTPGVYRAVGGGDGFVARLDDAGTTLQFATYFGGGSGEEVRGLALGPGDTPVVVGFTQSVDFPITPGAPVPTYRGAGPFLAVGDGFVARLNATGSALVFSTYLGGLLDDTAEAVHCDAAGAITVVGWTNSFDFPVTAGAFQTATTGFPAAQIDGFVARLPANGTSLVFSTLLGGNANEQLLAVERDPVTGETVVAGYSGSLDYPVTPGAARPVAGGAFDAVVTRLDTTGSALVWSTFLGGLDADLGQCLRVATDGTVWVGGTTRSLNFPLSVAPPQSTPGGDYDGFVSQLSANGAAILFSTRLGGPGADRVRSLDVGANGVVVVGDAMNGFPTTPGALQTQFAGGNLDGFLAQITYPDPVTHAASLVYSTLLGGAGQDMLGSVQLGNSGQLVLGGWTFSSDFPIAPAALQSQLLGVEDGVVMKFDLVSSLGGGVDVRSESSPTVQRVGAGEHELLVATLRNVTARDLVVDDVRLLVGGAGDARARVAGLRVLREVVGGSGAAQQLAGPFAITEDNGETALTGLQCSLPGDTTIRLRFVAELRADPSGASAEVVASVAGAEAWTLHAVGAGSGPTVHVLAPGRADGSCYVLGSLPGDSDDDGRFTVVDVRRLSVRLGTEDNALDCDGDGWLTAADRDAVREAVLGRTTVVAAPSTAVRSGWLTLRGLFPVRDVTATLAGRVLTVAAVTPRELVLAVPADQLLGPQELVVAVAGRVVFATLVTVQ